MKTILGLFLSVLLLTAGCLQVSQNPSAQSNNSPPAPQNVPNSTPANPPSAPPPLPSNQTPPAVYDPKINLSNFTSDVTNKYFSLIPGKKMVYETETSDGLERIEVYVTNEKRMVHGVETTVVWDRVWLEGDLIEDTRDYYAEDNNGTVWYFGEDTKEMALGKLLGTEGSWEYGVDGAQPGIVIVAEPKVGAPYRQEYYAGKAEDMGQVIAIGESPKVPFGNFTGCVKTFDTTPLEPDVKEYKFYCTGGIVLELEGDERMELVSVEYDSTPSMPEPKKPPVAKTKITEDDAKRIALERVPGKVTDITMEIKLGKPVYVVEVDADSGPETDVFIDIETGEVLAVES